MSLANNILKNLSEGAISEVDNLAQELFSRYYDEEENKFTKDLSLIIADRCDNNQEMINQVKTKLSDMVNELDKSKEVKELEVSPELKEVGNKISQILNNYGVKADFVNAEIGPRVTQYEFKLAPGTKINEVTNLNKEIAMGLAVDQVSIGPVEGSTTIGIQVPNKESTNVSLNDVMEKSDKRKDSEPF